MKSKRLRFLLLFLAITGITLSSCKTEPSETWVKREAETNQLEANLKLYESTWDEIVNKRKIDLINDTNFDTNITLITAPENIIGIEDFKAYYQNYLTGFSDVQFIIVDVFGQGDKIVKHWRFKGKHTGEFFGMPATGKEVDVQGVTLVKMKEGKIAQEQDFLDNLEFMQQLGFIAR